MKVRALEVFCCGVLTMGLLVPDLAATAAGSAAAGMLQGPPNGGRPSPGGQPGGGGRPGGQPGGGRPSPGGGQPGGGRPSPGGPPPRPSPGNRPSPPSGGNRPQPGRPGGPQPGRPVGGSRPGGRPPQRPNYSFGDGGNGWRLRHYFNSDMSRLNRNRRPHFLAGGFFPRQYVGFLQPIPPDIYGYLPPPPPGYAMGYYDGYTVVYDPATLLIASVLDLFRY